jgi:hypothetical protein
MRKVNESYEPVEGGYTAGGSKYVIGLVAAAILVVGVSLFWWVRVRG